VGNLDGLEAVGAGNWLATDWIVGALYRISPDGTAEQLLDLNHGSADLEYLEGDKLAVIPIDDGWQGCGLSDRVKKDNGGVLSPERYDDWLNRRATAIKSSPFVKAGRSGLARCLSGLA
jgi:hypothetical protein